MRTRRSRTCPCTREQLVAYNRRALRQILVSSIKEYLERPEKVGLSWPLSEEIDETSLENLLSRSLTPSMP